MNTTYFGLKDIEHKSNCERLFKEYKLGKKIGKGSYGTVYSLCKAEDCNFVLKVIEYSQEKYKEIGGHKLERRTKAREWVTEIKNTMKLISCQKNTDYQFIPTLYDAWFCKHKNGDVQFYLIYERFDGDLKDFIEIFSKERKEVKMLLKGFILSKFKLLEMALESINRTCKICLDDIKLENILYKVNENGSYDLVFSDFGTSKYGKNISEDCIKTDIRRFKQAVDEFNEMFTI